MTAESTPSSAPVTVAPVRPVIAIVGRPNVGKSTLFNRVTGTRQAITDDRPGVTRDRIHAVAEWSGHHFTLVDTGGYIPDSRDEMETQVRLQAEQAVEEADLVLLLCDATEGVTGLDRDVAGLLRRRDMPCLLVVNKVDHPDADRYHVGEFYGLGLGDPLLVSAANGRRSGDLLDVLVARFPELVTAAAADPDAGTVRIVLAGRPNVGKSTLINRLSGQEVSIVHSEPGTTRDATDVTLDSGGRRFVLVDTAGMRRRSRVEDPVEYFSALRASNCIERADVVVVLVDAVEGVTAQDARIMGHVTELGRGLVIAVNKWDLMGGGTEADVGAYRDEVRRRHPFLRDYPVLTLSALTGRRAARCLAEAAVVADRARARISTSRLNRWVEEVTRRLTPGGEREVRILYATQSGGEPPTFLLFSNRPDLVSQAYRSFLENCLREAFDLEGTPVRIHWRHSRSRRANRLARESG